MTVFYVCVYYLMACKLVWSNCCGCVGAVCGVEKCLNRRIFVLLMVASNFERERPVNGLFAMTRIDITTKFTLLTTS